MDFSNSIGLYTGVAIRNVGFIYDTDLPTKTIRRSYNLGVPLALKLGVFDKHMYLFGGGEYDSTKPSTAKGNLGLMYTAMMGQSFIVRVTPEGKIAVKVIGVSPGEVKKYMI